MVHCSAPPCVWSSWWQAAYALYCPWGKKPRKHINSPPNPRIKQRIRKYKKNSQKKEERPCGVSKCPENKTPMQKGQRGPADSSHVGVWLGCCPHWGPARVSTRLRSALQRHWGWGRGWATRATGKVRGLGAALRAPGESDPGNEPQKGLSVQLFQTLKG